VVHFDLQRALPATREIFVLFDAMSHVAQRLEHVFMSELFGVPLSQTEEGGDGLCDHSRPKRTAP